VLPLIGLVAAMPLIADASSARASVYSYRGVVYGVNYTRGSFDRDYYAYASYATMENVGGPKVAKLACDTAFDDSLIAKGCYLTADGIVKEWTAARPQDRDHGLLIAYYPNLRPHIICEHIAWNGSQWVGTSACL
jgi:hypothetical protein